MRILPILITLISLLALVSCNSSDNGMPMSPLSDKATTTAEAILQASATGRMISSATPIQPSPTPVPLAALVNGEAVTLSTYQSELARYTGALGREASPDEQKQVLNDLIHRVLLAQAAAKNGFVADETILQARIDELTRRLGSSEALEQWMTANGYNETDFNKDLQQLIQAAWMRDQVIAQTVPATADQIHARQILLPDVTQATDALSRLQSGADFTRLAEEYDPLAGGELGWIAPGYLLYPELEKAAFALQPGQYTEVIQTPIGFHILQVIERDPQRPLSPDALLQAQNQALQNWLEEQTSQAEIQIFVTFPTNPS